MHETIVYNHENDVKAICTANVSDVTDGTTTNVMQRRRFP